MGAASAEVGWAGSPRFDWRLYLGLARFADHDQDRANSDRLPLGPAVAEHDACIGRRDLDNCLVGLDLDNGLVGFDTLPLRDEPADDLRLGQTLPDVGKPEFLGH